MPLLGGLSGGNLAMGVAFQLKDEFSGTAAGIQKSMQQLDQYTDRMAQKIDTAMTQIRTGFAMAAAGAVLLAPSFMALEKAGEYEQLEVAMETMLKSREKAQALMREMDQFAKTTPFEIGPVRDSGRMLVAFGKQAEQVVPTLKLLGNVAAGVGMDIKELAELYGKNLQQPNLAMRDIWQMTNRGIPILEALAEVMGVQKDKIREMVEAGQVGVPQMEAAFRAMGEGTGRFAGLMGKQALTMKGMWSNALDSISLGLQSWGMQLLPLAKKVIGALQGILDAFRAFAESKVGSFILKSVTILGALLVVGGLVLILMGGMRFAVYKMAGAFGDMTKATILNTIAQKGMIAGLRQMAVAAWASIGPYALIAAGIMALVFIIKKAKDMLQSANPIIFAFGAALMFAMGPIGWIIGGIVLLKRAVSEFNKVGEDGSGLKGGFIGVLQKIGGIIQGVIELWRSWNEETQTFSLGESMYKKLEKMGLLQTVLNIGTYIARIKAFLVGVKEGFMEVMNWGKRAIMSIWNALQPAEEKFTKWGTLVDKATSSLERWKKAGKVIGIVLGVALLGLISLFVVLGIVSVIALAAIIIGMALIIAPFILLGYILKKIWDGLVYLYEAALQVWRGFKLFVSDAVTWTTELWASITSGVRGMWDSVVSAFDAMTSAVGNFITSAGNWFAGLWEAIKQGPSAVWDYMVAGAATAWAYITNMFTAIGATISGWVASATGWFSGVWDGITRGASALWSDIVDGAMGILAPILATFAAIGAAVSGFVQGALAWAGSLWASLTGGAAAAWDYLTSGASGALDAITGLFSGIGDTISGWVDSATAAVGGLWDRIKSGQAWDDFVNAHVRAKDSLVSAVRDMDNATGGYLQRGVAGLRQLWAAVENGTIWSTLKDRAVATWDAIRNGVEQVSPTVARFMDGVKSQGRDLWNAFQTGNLWETLKAKAGSAFDTIVGGVAKVSPTLASFITNVKDQAVGLWDAFRAGNLWDTLRDKATTAWNAIREGVQRVGPAITSFMSGVKSQGVDLWNAFQTGTLWDTLKSKATSAWNAIRDGVASVSPVAAGWMDTLRDKAVSLWNAFESGSIWDTLKNKAAAAWDTISGGIAKVSPTLASWMNSAKSQAADLWAAFQNGTLWDTLKSKASSALAAIGEPLNGIRERIVGLFQSGQAWAGEFFSTLRNDPGAAWDMLKEAASSVATRVRSAFSDMKDAVGGWVRTSMPWLADLWESAKAGAASMWAGVTGAVSGMRAAFDGWIQSALAWTSSLWASVTSGAAAMWSSVTGAVSGMASAIASWIGGAITTVSNGFAAMGNAIWSWITNAVSWVSSGFAAMYNAVTGWVNSVIGWITQLPSAIYNAGANMVTGLWDGMKSKWAAFKDWLASAVGGIPLLGSALKFMTGAAGWAGGLLGEQGKEEQGTAGVAETGPKRADLLGATAQNNVNKARGPMLQPAMAQSPGAALMQPVIHRTNIIKIGDREMGRFMEDEQEDGLSRNNGI